jgi:hypothetical protein
MNRDVRDNWISNSTDANKYLVGVCLTRVIMWETAWNIQAFLVTHKSSLPTIVNPGSHSLHSSHLVSSLALTCILEASDAKNCCPFSLKKLESANYRIKNNGKAGSRQRYLNYLKYHFSNFISVQVTD